MAKVGLIILLLVACLGPGCGAESETPNGPLASAPGYPSDSIPAGATNSDPSGPLPGSNSEYPPIGIATNTPADGPTSPSTPALTGPGADQPLTEPILEPAAGDVGKNWASFGGDLQHSRSNLRQTTITPQNVGELKPALDIKAPGVTVTPAVYGGVIYWSDWSGTVHATDAATQQDIWSKDRGADGGGYTGSPAVTERMVYVANRNGLLSAFERTTGEVVWEEMIDAGIHTHIWSSPVVAEEDNVLVVGVGGLGTRNNSVALPRSQLETFRGWVEGRDATTGEQLWRFDVTPMPSGAGVSVWSSAAMDTGRKVAYIGTGNNYYRPVSDYSDSLLALNYMTGEYMWHAQFTQNDAWTVGTVFEGGVDGDVGATPNLFAMDGRDVVGVGDKTGHYHLHDRETGEQIWSRRLTRGGYQGGVMAPAAVQDGIIYVVSNNDTASSTVFALNAADGGDILWEANLADPTFGGPAVGNGLLFVGDTAGNLRGYETDTGRELWRQELPGGSGAGLSFVGDWLLTGWGYHFSESRREPLSGGLVAFTLDGQLKLDEGMRSDCLPDTPLTADGTFTNVYQGVLCPLGCTKVCHSTSAEAGLNLEGKLTAYAGLVGVAAKGDPCVGKGTLVVPNDPDLSLLHGKLTSTPSCGVPMPPGGGAGNSPVTPAMLSAVRAWIAAGAPNN